MERLRIRSGLFEHSKDRCRLGRIRAGRPCRGQPSIPEQRREPRIRIILTWGRRHGDRGDRSGRTGDRGIGAVEGVYEGPLALRNCLVSLWGSDRAVRRGKGVDSKRTAIFRMIDK